MAGDVTLQEWTREYELVDSAAAPRTTQEGRPIPVTVPIELAAGVRVVYTSRLGGSSQGDFASLNLGGKGGDDPSAVLANRSALAAVIGAPLALVSQVHSGRALDADQVGPDDLADLGVIEADGLVCARPGIALGMFAADCLPVLLADPQAGVIGAAHCGRRGLERGIIAATVELMLSKGAQVSAIVATLGPSICGDCYEVGESLSAAFNQQFAGTATSTRFGGPGIDLAQAACQELRAAGVEHIVDSAGRVAAASQYLQEDEELARLCDQDGEGPSLQERMQGLRNPLCTLENPLWYSHRRAALAGKSHEGRMLALIVRS
ncbi:copper oxidase [Bombiscardovia nodaiensis]|uniref:Copper oxidase n=1 Tax=Bombiscardovia nodaiensis TaxID=2932181 RepID=A0ABM8B6T1_9BIFI|nr:copper oxidase [Bombiscardovia nodaiensis]